MRIFTTKELKEILNKHQKWLNDEDGGERADLRYADLDSANLRYADLRYANLDSADLSSANLRYANLSFADLSFASLDSADLRYADLFSTNLDSANLRYANLSFANLDSANLGYANLDSADLRYAKDVPFIPIACPDTGEFIAWKKVNRKIIKLKVTENAERCSATTSKCRCSEALVLAIENLDGTDSGMMETVNKNYIPFCTYKVGEIVKPDYFDPDRWNECAHGIHFFINREEAVRW